MTRHRRPGAVWRLLVHDMVGRGSGAARHVKSHRRAGLPPDSPDPVDTDLSTTIVLPGTEFDELVVGGVGAGGRPGRVWLHVEQMGDTTYWMDIAGVVVNVGLARDGTPEWVRVELEDPQPGCRYTIGGDAS